MADTKGRPGKPIWLLNHFTEYVDTKGKPHKLQVGLGRIRGSKQTPENAPWKFAPNEFGKLNIYGFIEYYFSGLGDTDYEKAILDPDIVKRVSRGELFVLG